VPKKEMWRAEPEPEDFSAADNYLALILRFPQRAEVVRQLKTAKSIYRQAKDLLRASRLALLPETDVDVAKELKKAKKEGAACARCSWLESRRPVRSSHPALRSRLLLYVRGH